MVRLCTGVATAQMARAGGRSNCTVVTHSTTPSVDGDDVACP